MRRARAGRISSTRLAAVAGGLTISVLLLVSTYLGSTSTGSPAVKTSPQSSSSDSAAGMALIRIPKGSYIEPQSFNVTELLTKAYQYPFNFTVLIGTNNTVEWMNDDIVAHTVSSFVVPPGAKTFNSDLIQPNSTFAVTLTVPGVYKYTCMWHPWLAGEITVKA